MIYCRDQCGKSTAETWLEKVTSIKLSHRKIVALGGDGQYHHNGVMEKFLEQFIPNDNTRSTVPFIWDPGI